MAHPAWPRPAVLAVPTSVHGTRPRHTRSVRRASGVLLVAHPEVGPRRRSGNRRWKGPHNSPSVLGPSEPAQRSGWLRAQTPEPPLRGAGRLCRTRPGNDMTLPKRQGRGCSRGAPGCLSRARSTVFPLGRSALPLASGYDGLNVVAPLHNSSAPPGSKSQFHHSNPIAKNPLHIIHLQPRLGRLQPAAGLEPSPALLC